MERLRAALLGCMLTGGVLFGPPPVASRSRLLRPVVFSAGPGHRERLSPEELARWFQPVQPGATVAALRAQAGLGPAHPGPLLDIVPAPRLKHRHPCGGRRR
jgi:hypothetical protein